MSKLSELRNDGLYELTFERVETDAPCYECRDPSEGVLLRFFSKMGNRAREHDGLFCSQNCHDRWHGLKSRS